MRHLQSITVQATFDKTPPDVSQLKGVSSVQVLGNELICQIQGPIDPLLTLLAKHHPKTLLSREPSLEELFLSLYGDKEIKVNK